MTPVNDPNHEKSHARTMDCSVFPVLEASVSHVSPGESNDSMHRETVAKQREKTEKVL